MHMKTVPEHTNEFLNWFLTFIVNWGKAFFLYFFWLLYDLWKFFVNHFKEKKSIIQRASFVFTIFIISYVIFLSFASIYKSLEKRYHKDYYTEVLFNEYETEIKKFFDKYNERYEAEDCWFMRKVAADEAMFEKRWKIEYWEKEYNCESFWINKSKKLIPISIWPIKQVDKKFYVEWQLLTLIKDAYWKYKISITEFSLRKLIDWDLWHFRWDLKWIGPTYIEFDKL